MSEDLMTVEEVAAFLGRATNTVYRHYVCMGRLPRAAHQPAGQGSPGVRVLFRRSDVEQLRDELATTKPGRKPKPKEPKRRPLTQREQGCLRWLHHHWRTYGCSPSLRELAHAMGVKDHKGPQEMLRRLAARGLVSQDENGAYRPTRGKKPPCPTP